MPVTWNLWVIIPKPEWFLLLLWGRKPFKRAEGLELRELLTINFPGTIGNPANHGSYTVAEFPKSYLSPVEQPATGNPFE